MSAASIMIWQRYFTIIYFMQFIPYVNNLYWNGWDICVIFIAILLLLAEFPKTLNEVWAIVGSSVYNLKKHWHST